MSDVLTPELFDSLTPGQIVHVTFGSCMSLSDTSLKLRVGRRSHSKKHGVDSITLAYLDSRFVHPKGNRIQVYKRKDYSGKVYVGMACGDMAVTCEAFKIEPTP